MKAHRRDVHHDTTRRAVLQRCSAASTVAVFWAALAVCGCVKAAQEFSSWDRCRSREMLEGLRSRGVDESGFLGYSV